jgi:hypothetical protein
MWVKLDNNSYFDMDHSCILGATGNQDGYFVQLVTPHTGGIGRKVRSGYESIEDAQDALDEFMAGVGFEELEVPEYSTEDDEESEEDTAYEDNYDSLNVEDLRTELSARQLSTSGNKKALVKRLRESDSTEIAISK